jgi:Phage tail protein (Tail_P2_I)
LSSAREGSDVRLLAITATAHRDGNRIDLAWTNPDPAHTPGVRVVRRESTHPAGPDDGTVVAHGTGLTTASDTGLKGETAYYYTLFPFAGTPPAYDPDPHNQASATALSPYDLAGRMYAMLPAIHRRYDAQRTPAPGTGLPGDRDRGQLRRFLDLPGGELDRLYGLARAALGLTDLDRVEGVLLPLLAQWIGWRTDHGLPVAAQRAEIRAAPRIHRTVGAVPALDATVARVTGWTGRTKEYVHNVARTNQPERLNLWWAQRSPAGTWTAPALASVNFAFDGRPAAVREADGSVTVFFHTYRRHGWDIWSKRFAAGAWQESRPVVDRPGIDKHPAAALQGNRLWLFWQSCDPTLPAAERRWRISYATRTGTTWSDPAGFGDPDTERRLPAAVADGTGGLWLFWLERTAGGWQLRYNRHDGTAWQLATPQTMPLDGGVPPRVEDDLFVLCHPTSAQQRLWVFWARQDPGGPPGQTRWSVAYRIKRGLDPAAADWTQVATLPRTGAHHDRQPAALVAADGGIEVFWSTTRHGGWSVDRATLATGPLTWGATEQVTTGPYTQRAPLAVDTGGSVLLAYRSNASLAHTAPASGATRTLDHRYAGTTTVDTGATGKLALRGAFEDFQTYTHDAGAAGVRTNDDRIARDTVGLYLTPDTADPQEVRAVVSRLAGVLPGFMPVTTRAVYVTE